MGLVPLMRNVFDLALQVPHEFFVVECLFKDYRLELRNLIDGQFEKSILEQKCSKQWHHHSGPSPFRLFCALNCNQTGSYFFVEPMIFFVLSSMFFKSS